MSDKIDEALWKKARELANASGGLVIDGLGTFHGARFTPAPGPRVDSPKLVVAVADELKGWDEPKIIVRFWLVSALLALLALGTLKVR